MVKKERNSGDGLTGNVGFNIETAPAKTPSTAEH